MNTTPTEIHPKAAESLARFPIGSVHPDQRAERVECYWCAGAGRIPADGPAWNRHYDGTCRSCHGWGATWAPFHEPREPVGDDLLRD